MLEEIKQSTNLLNYFLKIRYNCDAWFQNEQSTDKE